MVATPLASAAGLGTGVAGAAAVNASAGVLAAVVDTAIDPCLPLSLQFLGTSAFFGAAGGAIAGRFFGTQGMSAFGQVGFHRTWSGVIPRVFGGRAGPNAINAIYTGGGTSLAIGAAGPSVTQ